MSRNQHSSQQRRHDDDETDDYGYDHGSSYAMTPQQQRQDERKRHADVATASGTNPYGAKSNKSKKCKVIGWSTLVILLLAIGGVLAWYFAVFKKNEDKKNGSSLGTGGGAIAVGPTGNNPSPHHPIVTSFLFFLLFLLLSLTACALTFVSRSRGPSLSTTQMSAPLHVDTLFSSLLCPIFESTMLAT